MKYTAHIRIFDRDELPDGESVIGLNDYIHRDDFISNKKDVALSKAAKYVFEYLSNEPTVIINIHLFNGPCVKNVVINQ